MGYNAARFIGVESWNRAPDTNPPGHPNGTSQGLYLKPDQSATLSSIQLSPTKQYQISVWYRVASPGAYTHQSFWVKLGAGPGGGLKVPLDETATGRQHATTPYSNFVPTTSIAAGGISIYDLKIYRPSTISEPQYDIGLTIDYMCVSEYVSASGGGSGGGSGENTTSGACQICTYTPAPVNTGDALLNIRNAVQNVWNAIVAQLWCNLRRFFECVLMSILGQIAQAIVDFLAFVLGLGYWLVQTAGGLINWVVSAIYAVVRWFGGSIVNIARGLINFLQTIGLLDLLNRILGAIASIPSFIGQIINFIVGIFQFLGQAIGAVVQLVTMIWQFFITMIQAVVVIIRSIFDGFNTASLGTISGSVICSTPSTIGYDVCLGFYILDNTVFSGPAYYLFIIVVGLASLDTLVWALGVIRKKLQGGAE